MAASRGEQEAVWWTFVQSGQLDPAWQSRLDPAILRSWQRCALRLDPFAPPRLTVLRGEALERERLAHFDLLVVARPVMEDIYQWVEGSGFAVLLADRTACLLDVLGDAAIVEQISHFHLQVGAYWDEGRAGTNALALALREATPIQVTGAAHFVQRYHRLTCSAAPIHEPDGSLVGALAMIGPCEHAHAHTLATVMTGARAIANQFQTDLYLHEANQRLTELNGVFGAISEGLIAWDERGEITHLNQQAGELLRVTPRSVLGHPVAAVLPLPTAAKQATQRGEPLRDVELAFEMGGQSYHSLVTLQPVVAGAGQPTGYIATLRPIAQVRQLVNRQVGASATQTLDDLLGDSLAMRRVRRLAQVAARGSAPLLLRGEAGVGLDTLAQAIHNRSPRARGPFIVLHCASVPREQMAGEFLGYEAGAFNGALAAGRPSKFELADGGTLLLAGIENLAFEARAALLQVSRRGEVLRLGGDRPVPVDVRLIATTSANLEQLMAEGSFPRELYYHLASFLIHVPPLRERPEDIPALAAHLLQRLTREVERPVCLSDEALAKLLDYAWPGNHRELDSVLERAVALCEGGVIRVSDLPPAVRDGWVLTPGAAVPQPVLSLADAEREAIVRAGWACQGRVLQMAQRLGMSRSSLWRKMRAMKLDPASFKRSQ